MSAVAEKARRRGIGRALMEELFRRMQERKVRVIHLDVRIGNTPARNLYEEPRLCTGRHAEGVLRSPEGGCGADEPDG